MADPPEREKSIEEALKNRETCMTVLESTAVAAIVTAAIIGNVTLCLAIRRSRVLRKIQNYYIFVLSISDFSFHLLSVSLALVVVILGRWPLTDEICQVQGTLEYFLGSFSLLNMTLIALNRYVKMVRSTNIYQKIYTRNNVLLSIAGCGIFSGVFTVPFVLNKFCFHPGLLACFPCKTGSKMEPALLLSWYAVILTMTYPVVIFCYDKVFRKVRAHFAQIADSALHENTMKSFAEEVKITKILFIILVAFLIGWTPVFTIEILDTFHENYTVQRRVYLIIYNAGALIGVINPLIYGFMQKQFREAYKKVLTCKN